MMYDGKRKCFVSCERLMYTVIVIPTKDGRLVSEKFEHLPSRVGTEEVEKWKVNIFFGRLS